MSIKIIIKYFNFYLKKKPCLHHKKSMSKNYKNYIFFAEKIKKIYILIANFKIKIKMN